MIRSPVPLDFSHLPRVTRAQARLVGNLAAHVGAAKADEVRWAHACGALAHVLGGSLPTLEIGSTTASATRELAAHRQPADWVGVRLRRLDGRACVLIIDARLCANFAAVVFGTKATELEASRPATVAERGVFVFVVAAVLHAFDLADFVVDGTISNEEELIACVSDSQSVTVDMHCQFAAVRGLVQLVAPATLVSQPPTSVTAFASRLDAVSVAADVLMGAARLSVADVAGLAVGDVIVLDQAAVTIDGRGQAMLGLAKGQFLGTVADQQLTLTGGYERGEFMADEADGALADDLSVDLVCRLARVTMTAREALSLAPGSVVPLGRPVGSAVDLVDAAGKVIARGELVDVDGEIGVRIAEVA